MGKGVIEPRWIEPPLLLRHSLFVVETPENAGPLGLHRNPAHLYIDGHVQCTSTEPDGAPSLSYRGHTRVRREDWKGRKHRPMQ